MGITKKSIARLSIKDEEFASAFLISPQYVLTAKHIFENRDVNGVTLCFPNHHQEKIYEIEMIDFEENIAFDNFANDIAILKLRQTINNIPPLDLIFSSINEMEEWYSFGYPHAQRRVGEVFKGNVHNVFTQDEGFKHDVNLLCREPSITDNNYILTGVSGSPIMMNGKVIGVFSNESAGGVVGASTLQRSRELIAKYIEIPEQEEKIIETPLQHAIREASINTVNLIDGFPDELHEFLHKDLEDLKNKYYENPQEVEQFLSNSIYPKAGNEVNIEGLKAVFEVILLIKSMHGNVKFLKDDDFANLHAYSSEIASKGLHMIFVYASRRMEKMPGILLEMHNEMLEKSAASTLIQAGIPIPPNPVILDNCSTSKRFNLCNDCGEPFDFQEILKTYSEPEDGRIIRGIETNNLELLNEVKVLCANCIRDIQNHVKNQRELSISLEGKLYARGTV